MKLLIIALVGALVLVELAALWALSHYPIVAMSVMLGAPVVLLDVVRRMRG